MENEQAPVVFTNSETAAKYEALTSVDAVIHVPGGRTKGAGWKGKLSDITPAAAARLLEKKSNQLKEKAGQ